jgi:hypothetical protein
MMGVSAPNDAIFTSKIFRGVSLFVGYRIVPFIKPTASVIQRQAVPIYGKIKKIFVCFSREWTGEEIEKRKRERENKKKREKMSLTCRQFLFFFVV